MKNVAFIYSGDETDLNSLEYNRNGVAEKLKDFGDWKIGANRQLLDESNFIKDIERYKTEELDSLLIYYTGHGRKLQPSNHFQLKLSDRLGISLEILYARIFEIFETLPLKIAIVVDACYAGDIIYDTKQFGTSEIVTSSLGDKQSFEVGFPKDKEGNEIKSKMSLFSHYFCEAIETLSKELEKVNLLHIRNYINRFVDIQQSPYSFQTTHDDAPMSIAEGKVKEKYLGNIEVIYVRIYSKEKQYEIVVNGDTILTLDKDNILDETTQQVVVDKIESMLIPFTPSRVEFILPKELYGVYFPLWRKEITFDSETTICSLFKEDMSDKWLPQLQQRWDTGFKACQNMSFGHESVSVRVKSECMQDHQRISAIVEEQITDSKIFDGIDNHYFIALWINECQNYENYQELIKELSGIKLSNISSQLRSKIVDNPDSCISNLSLMWDDPYQLPKQGRKK